MLSAMHHLEPFEAECLKSLPSCFYMNNVNEISARPCEALTVRQAFTQVSSEIEKLHSSLQLRAMPLLLSIVPSLRPLLLGTPNPSGRYLCVDQETMSRYDRDISPICLS